MQLSYRKCEQVRHTGSHGKQFGPGESPKPVPYEHSKHISGSAEQSVQLPSVHGTQPPNNNP